MGDQPQCPIKEYSSETINSAYGDLYRNKNVLNYLNLLAAWGEYLALE